MTAVTQQQDFTARVQILARQLVGEAMRTMQSEEYINRLSCYVYHAFWTWAEGDDVNGLTRTEVAAELDRFGFNIFD